MSVHDRDGCGICYDRRALALRKHGLAARLIRELRCCGPAGLPMVRALASATPEQIEQINSLAARAA